MSGCCQSVLIARKVQVYMTLVHPLHTQELKSPLYETKKIDLT